MDCSPTVSPNKLQYFVRLVVGGGGRHSRRGVLRGLIYATESDFVSKFDLRPNVMMSYQAVDIYFAPRPL